MRHTPIRRSDQGTADWPNRCPHCKTCELSYQFEAGGGTSKSSDIYQCSACGSLVAVHDLRDTASGQKSRAMVLVREGPDGRRSRSSIPPGDISDLFVPRERLEETMEQG